MRRAWRRRLTFLLGALAACRGGEPVEPTGNAPLYLGATATVGPANGLSAIVTVRGVGYDSAFIRYRDGSGDGGTTPAQAFGPDSTSDVPVLGMLPDDVYTMEIVLQRGLNAGAVDTISFHSDTLPDWIPRPQAVGTDTTPGYLSVSYPAGAVIIDNQARVRWYLSNPDGVLNSFQAHDNGFYTSFRLSEDPPRFKVIDPLGQQTGTIGCVGRHTRFHDILVEEAGDYWIMCDDTIPMDLSGIGGQADAQTIWTVVQHVSAGGSLLWEWNSADHFDITDLAAPYRGGSEVNVTHGNVIQFDRDGNLIVSFRALDEITKIDVHSGDVIWRLGGLRNEFTFENDPFNGFAQQHGVRVLDNGYLQMLDNRRTPPSRLVRYLVNPVTRTATLVIDFRDSDSTFTPVGGVTEYYPNGHAIVTFGRAGRVDEIDEFGNKVWELTGIPFTYVFRVQKILDLYHPRRTLTP